MNKLYKFATSGSGFETLIATALDESDDDLEDDDDGDDDDPDDLEYEEEEKKKKRTPKRRKVNPINAVSNEFLFCII